MKVFNDYDFLAEYSRSEHSLPAHLQLALTIIESLGVKTILDIGGGSNSYVDFLSEEYEAVIVDMSEKSLSKVKAKEKKVGTLPAIPIDRSFDFVSALEVLEHLDPGDYQDSLKEIFRLSNRFIFITSPFLQDLSGAFVLCDKCRVEFQCEGHWRSFDFKKIFELQAYLGGLRDIYFCGPSRGGYTFFAFNTNLKKMVRRVLQKSVKVKYCRPPFTKCPECGHEMFHNYDEYLNRERVL